MSERRTKHDIRREATRAELIRLGLERVPVHGYAATSIRDIVAGSELTKGAFDYHYASKAEFFLELMDARVGPRGAFARYAREHPGRSLEASVAGALEHAAAGGGPDGAWTLAVGDFVRTDGAGEPYRERLERLYEQWRADIAEWIGVLQEQGLARTDLSSEVLSEAVFATIEGHVVHMTIYRRAGATAVLSIARILAP